MNVFFVASECSPFVKTGGLGDVVGALPSALTALGANVKVMLPAYPALQSVLESGTLVLETEDIHGGPARLVAATAEGLDLLLLDAPHLYDRPGSIYLDPDGNDWSDNHLRFGALCELGARVAIEGIKGWKPDVVNAHDWQAGLVPAYMNQQSGEKPPCVLTIHNIAFQGLFSPMHLETLRLSHELYTSGDLEYFGNLSFLKAGISLSAKITTVSPTYARELLQPEFGMGLDGLLRARRADLTGILNGIDMNAWDPETDAALVARYSSRSLKRKAQNRAEVESRFGLASNPDTPLFCAISRLSHQKGLDLLIEALPALVERGARLAVLGSGDKDLESNFIAAAHRYAGSVGVVIGYDESLSHLLQGGSDAILVPSRFEPCGLTQLYGLRYGTLPVVARTGGLADTVIDANEAAITQGCATGFQFSPTTATALSHTIDRVCSLFKNPKVWNSMMRRAMSQSLSWEKSAAEYLRMYEELQPPTDENLH